MLYYNNNLITPLDLSTLNLASNIGIFDNFIKQAYCYKYTSNNKKTQDTVYKHTKRLIKKGLIKSQRTILYWNKLNKRMIPYSRNLLSLDVNDSSTLDFLVNASVFKKSNAESFENLSNPGQLRKNFIELYLFFRSLIENSSQRVLFRNFNTYFSVYPNYKNLNLLPNVVFYEKAQFNIIIINLLHKNDYSNLLRCINYALEKDAQLWYIYSDKTKISKILNFLNKKPKIKCVNINNIKLENML